MRTTKALIITTISLLIGSCAHITELEPIVITPNWKFSITFQNVDITQIKALTDATINGFNTLKACKYYNEKHPKNAITLNDLREKKEIIVRIASDDELDAVKIENGFDDKPLAYASMYQQTISMNPRHVKKAEPIVLEETMAHELMHLSGMNHDSPSQYKWIKESFPASLHTKMIKELKVENKEFYHTLEQCGYQE